MARKLRYTDKHTETSRQTLSYTDTELHRY